MKGTITISTIMVLVTCILYLLNKSPTIPLGHTGSKTGYELKEVPPGTIIPVVPYRSYPFH